MWDYQALANEYVKLKLEPCPDSLIFSTTAAQGFREWLDSLDPAPYAGWAERMIVPKLRIALELEGFAYRQGRVRRADRVSTSSGWSIEPANRTFRGWRGLKFRQES